ncbi:betaine aldehyde dehydrogenase-like [Onthophagus taurus]|uniref:betaine aldehyde dehydrogenase-like n=1 Tax=Onthophagus taurus TaxID=166361 RepID=UPI0039BDAC8A
MALKTLNKTKIGDVFKKMDYQSVPIDISKAQKWLVDTNYFVTEYDDLKKTFEKIKENTEWKNFSNPKKTECLYQFSKEIESNTDILCQFKYALRRVLPKDTKIGLEQLNNYLQYYSTLIEDQHVDEVNDENVVLCCIDTKYEISLAELGYVLGSTLAGGRNIIFTGNQDSWFLNYLIDLSIKAGIPEETINFICTKSNDLQQLCSKQIQKNIKIDDIEEFNDKKVLITPNLKGSMIIFNDSDLDSAVETAVKAIWGSCGLLPWSIDTLLVQEDIVKKFSDKLKIRLKKLELNEFSTNSDDISFFYSDDFKGNLDKMEKEAKSQGIEIFKAKETNNTKLIVPTLFIGGKVSGNKIMSEINIQPTVGTILAFRTPKEAINLANNNRQGLAVSLWSQNISLINEVVRKIDVGTIWVNCHGVIKGSVGFTTRKYEGIGYFGGYEGYYEFNELIEVKTTQNQKTSSQILSQSKKAQDSWNKLPFKSRAEKIFKIVRNNSEWMSSFYKAVNNLDTINTSQIIDNFDLKSYRDPIGVVIINKSDKTVPDLVLGALLLGNSVLIVENNNNFITELIKNLPLGVFGSVSSSELALESLKQSVVVIGGEKPVPRSFLTQKMYDYKSGDLYKFIIRRCTIKKNVWVDVGDSF